MSPVSELYLERDEEISSSLAVGCKSLLREKAHASGYIMISSPGLVELFYRYLDQELIFLSHVLVCVDTQESRLHGFRRPARTFYYYLI